MISSAAPFSCGSSPGRPTGSGPGQGGIHPLVPLLMEAVKVPRLRGPAQNAHRRRHGRQGVLVPDEPDLLRIRRIKAVISEPSNQIGYRKRSDFRRGRPVNFDFQTYNRRNSVGRSFGLFKQWRATRKLTRAYVIHEYRRRQPVVKGCWRAGKELPAGKRRELAYCLEPFAAFKLYILLADRRQMRPDWTQNERFTAPTIYPPPVHCRKTVYGNRLSSDQKNASLV